MLATIAGSFRKERKTYSKHPSEEIIPNKKWCYHCNRHVPFIVGFKISRTQCYSCIYCDSMMGRPYQLKVIQNSIGIKLTDFEIVIIKEISNVTVQAIHIKSNVRAGQIYMSWTPNSYGYISCFGIEEKLRNNGLGSLVFKTLLDEAKIIGLKELRLGATERAKSLYQRFGFKFTISPNRPDMVLTL